MLAIAVVLTLAPRSQALPADPNNAALLYYQGFLILADLDKEAKELIAKVARGEAPPDDKVREHITECHEAIEFAEAAIDLPLCDWGLRFSEGFETPIIHLTSARSLAWLLMADARVRVSDGDYRGAFERCLMTIRFARHIGDDTVISLLVSLGSRDTAYRCMRDVVGQVTDNAELLEWLQPELAACSKRTASLIRAVEIEKATSLDMLRTEKVEALARFYAEDDEMAQQCIIFLANEMVLEMAREFYTKRITTVLSILNRPMPYEQAYTQLKELGVYFKPLDMIGTMTNCLISAFSAVYSLNVRADSHANALTAGVEICLHKARFGELPTALPADQPKDPFSGEDFEYERTDDGFVLRCRAKDLLKDTVHEYAFTLK